MVTHLPQDPEDLPVTVTAVVACAAHEASKPRLLLDGTKVVVYIPRYLLQKLFAWGEGPQCAPGALAPAQSVGPDFVHEL